MSSNSEVGHAKNVGNFKKIIEAVIGFGPNYNPSKASLKIPNLTIVHTSSTAGITHLRAQTNTYNTVINHRALLFTAIRPLSTRLLNALETTDAPDRRIDDFKAFHRKIQGKRASKVEIPSDPNAEPPKTISTSQQSYDQIIEHFKGEVGILEEEPTYTPNEVTLTISTLQDMITALIDANNQVATAHSAISRSRADRNKALYNPETGLVDIAKEVKKYIKAAFGPKSSEYDEISGLAFLSPRRV